MVIKKKKCNEVVSLWKHDWDNELQLDTARASYGLIIDKDGLSSKGNWTCAGKSQKTLFTTSPEEPVWDEVCEYHHVIILCACEGEKVQEVSECIYY